MGCGIRAALVRKAMPVKACAFASGGGGGGGGGGGRGKIGFQRVCQISRACHYLQQVDAKVKRSRADGRVASSLQTHPMSYFESLTGLPAMGITEIGCAENDASSTGRACMNDQRWCHTHNVCMGYACKMGYADKMCVLGSADTTTRCQKGGALRHMMCVYGVVICTHIICVCVVISARGHGITTDRCLNSTP